jgi:hypothetical protein
MKECNKALMFERFQKDKNKKVVTNSIETK